LDKLAAAMYEAGFNDTTDKILLVTQKQAVLKIYSSFGDDADSPENRQRAYKVRKAILMVDDSGSTCEICGQPAKLLTHKGWWYTRCPEHAEDFSKPKMTINHSTLLAKWPFLVGVPLEHDLGWAVVLDKMMTAMVNAGFNTTRDKVVQSKEKLGCLSLTVDINQSREGDDLRRAKINEAIRLSNNSARVCEVCGEPGIQMVSGSCRMARCAEHTPEGAKTLREHYARADAHPMTKESLRLAWPCLKGVYLEFGNGWCGVLDCVLTAMIQAGFDPKRDQFAQIKEKFGSLRIYVDYAGGQEGDAERAERVERAISLADTSATTCEICGKPGQIQVADDWWSTRCTEHKKPTSQTLQEAFGKPDGQ
jgi:hypothetical protein